MQHTWSYVALLGAAAWTCPTNRLVGARYHGNTDQNPSKLALEKNGTAATEAASAQCFDVVQKSSTTLVGAEYSNISNKFCHRVQTDCPNNQSIQSNLVYWSHEVPEFLLVL